MKRDCLSYSELPGTSALFRDYLYNFDRVSRFYDYAPNNPGSLRASAAAIQYPPERRAQLVQALRRYNGDSPALEVLSQPGSVAVVTGQQVGLFSGPAYTIYKALTAARLAERLTDGGLRAVPVFWLATEDHDFAEIDHTYTFDVSHRPVRLQAAGSPSPGQPVGTVPIREVPLNKLRNSLEGFLYREEVIGLVEECYTAGKTFGAAFHELLRRLLAPYGIVFIDPLAEDIRAIAAPFLAQALERDADLSTAIIDRGKELREAGYHSQVHFEPRTSLFFRLESGRRVSLRRHDSEYYSDARKITKTEMAADPAALSPNALLRPVMQDYLLPTVAYVGGPAELAYLAQSQVVYHTLLGRMPVAQPRAGFTIVDHKARVLLDRYELGITDCFQGVEHLCARIGDKLLPRGLDEMFGTAASAVASATNALEEALRNFDPTLAEAMAHSKSKMEYQIAKNRRKAAQEGLRREQRALEGVAHLSGLLFPEEHIQERYYSLLPFLAKHGLTLVDQVAEAIQATCPDHILLQI